MIYKAINRLMKNKRWWTIPDLDKALRKKGLRSMQTSISARIRQQRGRGFTVERMLKPGTKLYQYRLAK